MQELTSIAFLIFLLLGSRVAHADVTLTASNSTPGQIDAMSSTGVSFSDPVENFWPYCDRRINDDPQEAMPCLTREVTLGPGRIKDVNITVDWGWGAFPNEGYLNLWHADIDVVLAWRADGPSGGRFLTTFDDEALIGPSANPIEVDPDIYSGPYRPVQTLSAFDGQNAAGPWILTFADFDISDSRRFYGMTLDVVVAPVPEPSMSSLMFVVGLASFIFAIGLAKRRGALKDLC